jgi:tetratricopeptide (TPR) repeat protein
MAGMYNDDRPEEARADLAWIRRRWPECVEATLALALHEMTYGNWQEALNLALKVPGPDARRIEACCHLLLGRPDTAIALLEPIRGHLPEVTADLGTCYLLKGDYARAESEYRGCLDCPVAAYHRAVALTKLGRLDEALDALEQVIRRAGDELDLLPVPSFEPQFRMSDAFHLLPQEMIEKDPELAPLRERPGFHLRIVPLLRKR